MASFRNPMGANETFQNILSYYNESHRAHHVLEHIVNMLDEFDAMEEDRYWMSQYERAPEGISGNAHFQYPMELAIWFHDAVYNPRAKDNEELSAVLLADSLKKLGIFDSVAFEHSKSVILDTKHTTKPRSDEGSIVVSIDLAILGKSEEEFDRYETNIRKEYEWVPWMDYCKGRSAIIQSFLDRSSIYFTDFFRHTYEASARKNLARSIEKLKF